MAQAAQAGKRRGPGGIGWLWWLMLAVALGTGVGWLVWWSLVGEERAREAVTVADILQKRELQGQTVMVTGFVAGPVGRRAFLLEGEAGEQILVLLGPELGATELPQVGQVVQVTGEVIRVDAAARQREGGQLDSKTLAQWVGRQAVVASGLEPYVDEP